MLSNSDCGYLKAGTVSLDLGGSLPWPLKVRVSVCCAVSLGCARGLESRASCSVCISGGVHAGVIVCFGHMSDDQAMPNINVSGKTMVCPPWRKGTCAG